MTLARRNWFYALLPVWALASWGLWVTHSWNEQPLLGEAIVLFDWCLFVPATFALCYRGMPPRALALRLTGLACGGIWLAGQIVPAESQFILLGLSGVRWLGLSVLLLFEMAAIAAMARIVFGQSPDPRRLERQGIPPLVAKAMIAEARFWRWVWARLTGNSGK